MTNLIAHERQWVLAAVQKVSFDDLLPAGVSPITIELPPGAVVLRGGVRVVTPFNATGAALLDVGLVGGSATAFHNDLDIETAAYTAFATGQGTYLPNGGKINLTGVATAGSTAGELLVVVEYVVVGRGNEVQ